MKVSLVILLVALAIGLPVTVRPQATIEGRVVLTQLRTAPVANQRYEIVSKGGILSSNPPLAVVYLEGSFPRPESPPVARILQRDLTFEPHLLAVQAGTTIEFPNLDDIYHNVFSYSKPKRFDLGRYRADELPVPTQVFDTPGLVTLRCDVHEHMRAVILILDTPYFVVTDAEGRFRLTDLPAGNFTLKAWVSSSITHERAVEIVPGAKLEIDLP